MEVSNYRPISVLNIFSKIFERHMYNKLIKFLDHSTQQAIITLIIKIISCIDSSDMMI